MGVTGIDRNDWGIDSVSEDNPLNFKKQLTGNLATEMAFAGHVKETAKVSVLA